MGHPNRHCSTPSGSAHAKPRSWLSSHEDAPRRRSEDTLGLSRRTVEKHTAASYAKLGVRTRAEAIVRMTQASALGGPVPA